MEGRAAVARSVLGVLQGQDGAVRPGRAPRLLGVGDATLQTLPRRDVGATAPGRLGRRPAGKFPGERAAWLSDAKAARLVGAHHRGEHEPWRRGARPVLWLWNDYRRGATS